MRNIIHFAVDDDRAGVWAIFERLDYASRVSTILVGRRETLIDRFDLVRVDGDAGDKAVTSRTAAACRQTFRVTKVGVQRIDGENFSGGRGEQTHRARDLIRRAPVAVWFLVGRRANGRAEVLGAPSQRHKSGMRRDV